MISLNPYLLGTAFNAEAGITGFADLKRASDVGSFPDFAWTGYTNLAGSSFDQRPKTQDRYTREFHRQPDVDQGPARMEVRHENPLLFLAGHRQQAIHG